MLPRMYCSVKFLDPTVIVGPPPPPEPELSVPPTLPQATTSSNARPVSSAGTARISLVLFFILPPLSFALSTASLLRNLEPFRGECPLQCAEADLCQDRQDRQAWYGAPDVTDVDGNRRAEPRVAYHQGDGQRYSDGDEQCGQGEQDVLSELLREVRAGVNLEYPEEHATFSLLAPTVSGSVRARGAADRR